MAESTLTLDFDDLKSEVGFFLNYTSDSTNWSTAQENEIEKIVQTGYRRVLFPPAMQGVPQAYEWSFLRPTTTLAISADDGDYDLPDDLGRVVGDFHYAADKHYAPVKRIPLSQLLDMRSTSDMNGWPNFFAVRWKDTDESSGQRQEALFYPEPDASYTLYYIYEVYTGQLSDTYKYPLGGMQMSELYKESCLAYAEERNEDQPGVHSAAFARLLADQVARDMKRGGGHNYGQMGQGGELEDIVEWRRGNELHNGSYSITYSGNYI
jgi:hypothetical protein